VLSAEIGVGQTVDDTTTLELMQVRIRPAHDDLEHTMQLRQADAGG